MIRALFAALALVLSMLSPALGQDRAWVQIEAQPSLAEAETRARAWAAVFPDVQGYALGGTWYGIVLGPYDTESADARRRQLARENLIPRDSFVTDGMGFEAQFWPVGADMSPITPDLLAAPEPEALPDAPTDAQPDTLAEQAVPQLPDETAEEARQSESILSQIERETIQTALEWFGFYDAAIDGAFGRGTRASMAAWQAANGYDPTGILTTAQRAELVTAYAGEQAAFGFELITEPESGIEVTIPAALLDFDHYEPPFVHYLPKDGSGLRLVLISTPGDQATLAGLYDTLQTLEIMPQTGPRDLRESSFSLRGESAAVISQAEVSVARGLVKGWMLSWEPGDARIERILPVIRSSFRPVGDRALDPGLVPLEESARQGLLAGLEVRRPKLSRSGFYVDPQGTVLTTAEAVAQCGRITLDGTTDATVKLAGPEGLALLSPKRPLAPPATAAFQMQPDRIGAEVAVSGYSYEDRLSAPVLTFGTLAEAQGLEGETGMKRLILNARPGDAGGPVIDGTGAVLGMLLPRDAQGGKVLPPDVSFAATAQAIASALAPAGVTLGTASSGGAMAPEDLARRAADMTVLVSCWD